MIWSASLPSEFVRSDAFIPRSAADVMAYVMPLIAGPTIWFFVVGRTESSEAWDEGIYWPIMLGTAFVLGALVANAGVPYVEGDDMPLAGLLVAAIMFASCVPCVVVTAPSINGLMLLPVALVMFLPLFTAIGGAAATLGIYARRGPRALLRDIRRSP
jgi:hypothetical protein